MRALEVEGKERAMVKGMRVNKLSTSDSQNVYEAFSPL
jgi:hypothetical protein